MRHADQYAVGGGQAASPSRMGDNEADATVARPWKDLPWLVDS